MPETNFHIQWPDGQPEVCYSPSLVVKKYLEAGQSYTITDFVGRSRESLQMASDRVQAKYGFACSRVLGQLKKIETTAQQYKDLPEKTVTVLRFES